jgi:hypothetical protein
MSIDIRTNDQIEWMQEALYYGMLSCDLFAPLNLVLEKKFRADKAVQMDSIWLSLRDGQSACGAGLLVEMPRLIVDKPNSQVNHVIGSVVVFEERNLNFTPGAGTMKSAEQWTQLAVEFMRGWIIGQAGGLVVEPNAIVPAKDWMPADPTAAGGGGIIALRGSVSQRAARPNYPRCGSPNLAIMAPLTFALTNSATTLDAEIYFTTDGSVPRSVPDDSGAVAQRYTQPFTVPTGTLVQWVALKSGFLPSHIGAQVVTN